jgi:hypothetical protein
MRSTALLLPFLLVATPGHTSPCDSSHGLDPRVNVVGWRGFIPDPDDRVRGRGVADRTLALCPMPVDRPEVRWVIPMPTSGFLPGSGVLKRDATGMGPVTGMPVARAACWNPLG